MVAWGDNTYGQSTVSTSLTNVIAIAARGDFSIALKNDETVVAWGRNSNGQTNVPANLGNVIKIASGYFHSMVIQSNGLITCWGSLNTVPAGISNAFAIDGSDGTGFAIYNTTPATPVQPSLSMAMAAAVLVSGQVGQNYQIQYCDALTGTNNWQFLTILTLTNSPQAFIDAGSLFQPKRFYRALLIQ